MVGVLEHVLQTSNEERLTRKNPGDPLLISKLHKDRATLSNTESNICTGLCQELAKMKVIDFDHPIKSLDVFDSYLTTINKIKKGSPMPDSLSNMYMKPAFNGNRELQSAWTQCETNIETMNPGTTPTYDEYDE